MFAHKSILIALIAFVAFSSVSNSAPLPSNTLQGFRPINLTTVQSPHRNQSDLPPGSTTYLAARGKSKSSSKSTNSGGNAAAQPATPATVQGTPGQGQVIDQNTPADSIAPGSKKAVNNFVNPSDPIQEKKLTNSIQDQLDTPSSTGKTIYTEKSTGLRLDNQGPSAANGVKANFQVQQNAKNGKSTCATCVVHEGSNATPDDVKSALATSAKEEKNVHIFRKRQLLSALAMGSSMA